MVLDGPADAGGAVTAADWRIIQTPVVFMLSDTKARPATRETFERYRRAAVWLFKRTYPKWRVMGSSATSNDLDEIFGNGVSVTVLIDYIAAVESVAVKVSGLGRFTVEADVVRSHETPDGIRVIDEVANPRIVR